MNHLSMALKNLKNNFSFYALYLLSISFVITIFFAFTSFSMNKVMLEKISGDGRVETMCNTISIFLMAFVILYVLFKPFLPAPPHKGIRYLCIIGISEIHDTVPAYSRKSALLFRGFRDRNPFGRSVSQRHCVWHYRITGLDDQQFRDSVF